MDSGNKRTGKKKEKLYFSFGKKKQSQEPCRGMRFWIKHSWKARQWSLHAWCHFMKNFAALQKIHQVFLMQSPRIFVKTTLVMRHKHVCITKCDIIYFPFRLSVNNFLFASFLRKEFYCVECAASAMTKSNVLTESSIDFFATNLSNLIRKWFDTKNPNLLRISSLIWEMKSLTFRVGWASVT